MARPFKNVRNNSASGSGDIVTVRYFWRELKRVLGKLHFKVDGGDISEMADGGISIKVNSGGGTSAPLTVSGTKGSYTVSPGMIFSHDFSSPGNPVFSFVPEINGTPLDASPAPILTTDDQFTGFIALTVEFSSDDGSAKNWPWQITAVRTLRQIVLVRDLTGQGEDALFDIPLVRVSRGVLGAVGISGSQFITTTGNTILYSNA